MSFIGVGLSFLIIFIIYRGVYDALKFHIKKLININLFKYHVCLMTY